MLTKKEFGAVVDRLIRRHDLDRAESVEMFRAVLANEQPDLQQGAFMAALTAKGETAEEIAGAWEAIYQLDTVKVFPHCSGPVVDNCGTGMDSFKTFNISTVAAIIAAAGGAHVARHGARGITSSCGTVDIAEALGVDVECTAEVVCRSIEEAGLGLFNGMSAHIHPKALGRILAQINFGTTLNIAASLASPVRPLYAVRGVSSRQMLRPVAEAMREIGYKRALVVHGFAGRGELGMDEASVCDTTYAVELDIAGTLKEFSTSPEQLGLPRHRADELAPLGSPASEAQRIKSTLEGRESAAITDCVCLNAGCIFYVLGKADSLRTGYLQAVSMIKDGSARAKLDEWVSCQQTARSSRASLDS